MLVGIALGDFFLFTSITPFIIAMMTCVSNNLRGQCNAVSLFVSFTIGGIASPTAIGAIFEASSQLIGMLVAVGVLILAAIFWCIAWFISKQRTGPLNYKWNFCASINKNHSEKKKLIDKEIAEDNEKSRVSIFILNEDSCSATSKKKTSIIGT